MGLPNFLVHVLRSSGRVVDLMDYCSVEGNTKPLRIAIDVSSWIHGACQGHSDVLASDKHLSNYGRAALLEAQNESMETDSNDNAASVASQHQTVLEFVAKVCTTVVERLEKMQAATHARLLVVFDGASPPIKSSTVSVRRQKRKLEEEHRNRPVDESANSPMLERRIQANRRAGAGPHFDTVVDAILVALRSREIAFMVAPYEADAQLAFLQHEGLVDLIVVDDSDLIAYGLATPALYKLSVNPDHVWTRGILLRQSDLAAHVPGGGGHKGSTVVLDFLDFTPAMLACLFASLGCDYCAKLTGIGTPVACRLVRESFFPARRTETSPLERLLTLLLQNMWKRHSLSDEKKEAFRHDFLAAVFMFRHAIVYDPRTASCRSLRLDDEADPELVSYEPYAQLLNDPRQRRAIVGDCHSTSRQVATYLAEGWICAKTRRLRDGYPVPLDVTQGWAEHVARTNAPETDDETLERDAPLERDEPHARDAPCERDSPLEREAPQHVLEDDSDDPDLESQMPTIHHI